MNTIIVFFFFTLIIVLFIHGLKLFLWTLVVEGRKITKEIFGFVMRTLLKEGNFVAAVCAVLGYFALVRRNGTQGGGVAVVGES